jgi:hypothetical protein
MTNPAVYLLWRVQHNRMCFIKFLDIRPRASSSTTVTVLPGYPRICSGWKTTASEDEYTKLVKLLLVLDYLPLKNFLVTHCHVYLTKWTLSNITVVWSHRSILLAHLKDTQQNKIHMVSFWIYPIPLLFAWHLHILKTVHIFALMWCRMKGSQYTKYMMFWEVFPVHHGNPWKKLTVELQ